MALWADPRFSDSEGITPEQRVDRAYERSGIGPGLAILACIAFALILFGGAIGLGHPVPDRIWTTNQSLDRSTSNQSFANADHRVAR
jgi:hypothetical protein